MLDPKSLDEKYLVLRLTNLIATKYNISLIILTAIMWFVVSYVPYNSSNFDLLSSVINYLSFFSAGSIAVAFIARDREGAQLVGGLSMLTFILSVFTLIAAKSVYFNTLGFFLFFPLNIFLFFLLLKNIWLSIFIKSSSK